MSNEEVVVENKPKSEIWKSVVLVIIFLAIGLGIGIYGTSKYLDAKDDEIPVDNNDYWPLDISSKVDYQEQINSLYSIIQGEPMFYSSGGISYNVMSNQVKLTYMYNYLMAKQIGETATLDSLYFASPTCNYDFTVDPGASEFVISNICTVIKIPKTEFAKLAEDLFNDKEFNNQETFYPTDGKKCVVENDYYLCGNVPLVTNVTGELEPKFEKIKVTLDKDDTITIYDKGYLVDKRSNVKNPNDGYDNYYLHTSDSTEYYYELKSADNVTFRHTFKKNESGKYYFVSSIPNKE